MKIVKKLTNVEWLSMPIGSSVLLTGTIRMSEEGFGTYGRWVRFRGSFAAQFTDLEGKVSTLSSGQMFVPEILESMLESATVTAMNKHGDDFAGVEFAFRLKKDVQPKKSETDRGYKWAVETVVEPEVTSSPALRMLAQYGTDPRTVAAQIEEKSSEQTTEEKTSEQSTEQLSEEKPTEEKPTEEKPTENKSGKSKK